MSDDDESYAQRIMKHGARVRGALTVDAYPRVERHGDPRLRLPEVDPRMQSFRYGFELGCFIVRNRVDLARKKRRKRKRS